jgi:hypothetical protein
MIDQIELWQTRANTTGQMGIAVHLEEIVEWLETFDVIEWDEHISTFYSILKNQSITNLQVLSNALKDNQRGIAPVINNREKFADAIGDQIVTAVAAGCRNGMNVSAIVGEINRSNWSKFDDNGMPIYDQNGKVKKGPNYVKANLEGMF